MIDGTINNIIVSNYSNLDELKDAIICSCYLPGFSSWKQVPNYKNKPYLDGGFSNNQPVLQEDCTLRYNNIFTIFFSLKIQIRKVIVSLA
jgi:hypothetical protein